MRTPKSTIRQLEQVLSRRISHIYETQLGHEPTPVSCQFFQDKVAIILENSITHPEKLLVARGQKNLADQIRASRDEVIQLQLKGLIKELLGVSVIDLLGDTSLETGRTGIIIILAEPPDLEKSWVDSTAVLNQATPNGY